MVIHTLKSSSTNGNMDAVKRHLMTILAKLEFDMRAMSEQVGVWCRS